MASATPDSPPVASTTPEPSRRLPPEARGYFVVGSLAWAVPTAIGAFTVAGVIGGDLPAWGIRVAAVAVLAVGGVALPLLRWRRWRYEVRDEELDLLRGALVVTRTVVPMTRVQHVDTIRTVIGDLFDLQSVAVHTAAGSNAIPALRPAEAAAIRDRIAQLARRPDEL
jgi:membrane protein YdbS with pleckstrin-like domain